ncbi:MAG: Clp protease ClpP [Clostridium sp.]|nr:Clp protease ClpP [Clostridium sp.]
MQRFYALEQDNKKAIISIYDDIYSGSGLPKRINDLNADEIEVHISSYGGDVIEGLAIYNALKNHKAKITTIVDGFACSIASVIFCAGDKRFMNESSLLMIHNAWVMTFGNADDLRKEADDLEKITNQSLKIYECVSNLSSDDIKSMMDNETWLDAGECKEYQFATDIIKNQDGDKATQSIRRQILQKFKIKQEENKMDPITVGDFSVEVTEDDGGLLIRIKPAEANSDELTAEEKQAIEKFVKSLIGGNK